MNKLNIKITKYTKSQIASIQYGDDPTNSLYDISAYNYFGLNEFLDELMRLIEIKADITIINKEYKS